MGRMNSTHWRPCLTLALHRNRRSAQARYAQLATIREDGRPANRTVVFRGFVEETDLLIFTADDRSRKVEQVERAPWAEACWYFPDSREQFRLLGRPSVVRAVASTTSSSSFTGTAGGSTSFVRESRPE